MRVKHDPEFTAVILAATCGARLFPISYSGDEQDAFGGDSDDDNSVSASVDSTMKSDGDGKVSGGVRKETTGGVGGDNDNGDCDGGAGDIDGGGKKTEKGSSSSVTNYLPKHLLPLVGRPILYHLLLHLKNIGFELCVVAIGSNDEVTVPALIEEMSVVVKKPAQQEKTQAQKQEKTTTPRCQDSIQETRSGDGKIHTIVWENRVTVVVVRLPSDCGGSADALRHLSNLKHDHDHNNTPTTKNTTTNTTTNTTKNDNDTPSSIPTPTPILPPESHIMILPADLILYGHLNGETTDEDALSSLADAHRINSQTGTNYYQPNTQQQRPRRRQLPPPTAVTLLLTDVSEYDDNGLPLKESAKAKKGGLARDDDEIEYIALSSDPSHTPDLRPSADPTEAPSPRTRRRTALPPRVLLKRSKYSVEEDVENTASTPKLVVPKASFRYGECDSMTVRTDWSDVHVFVISPWVVRLLHARTGVKDLAKELIPLLIKRQFRGVAATFGVRSRNRGMGAAATTGGSGKSLGVKVEQNEEEEKRRLLEGVLARAPFREHCWDGGASAEEGTIGAEDTAESGAGGDHLASIRNSSGGSGGSRSRSASTVDYPYAVAAKVLSRSLSKLTLRACTIPAYLYGCRETILHATSAVTTPDDSDRQSQSSGTIPLPENTTLDKKFNSIILPLATLIGDKVQIKSSTVGRGSKLGGRCRLNNVVVMDDVTVGDNCVLQNSVLAKGCAVGDNCNLKECQVGAGYRVLDGTKATGECFFDG